MFIQERANYVLWNLRNRADTTDPPIPEQNDEEGAGEEESMAEDEVVHESPGGAQALPENMRLDQTAAVSGGWHTDASQIQSAMMRVIPATSGPSAEGMSMEVVTEVRNLLRRLFRWRRKRGNDEKAARYRT
eukprot:s935_g26.t1